MGKTFRRSKEGHEKDSRDKSFKKNKKVEKKKKKRQIGYDDQEF